MTIVRRITVNLHYRSQNLDIVCDTLRSQDDFSRRESEDENFTPIATCQIELEGCDDVGLRETAQRARVESCAAHRQIHAAEENSTGLDSQLSCRESAAD